VSLALALFASGCSQSALVGAFGGPDAGPPPLAEDAGSYVDGALHAHAVFNMVNDVFWIGSTGDPSRIELYLIETTASCEEISMSHWRESVRPSDLMGITLGGTTPGTYTVAADTPPAPGHAYLLHEIDQANPVIDSVGEAGTVTLFEVKPGESLSGSLVATFSTGTLEAAFRATWCPTGITLQ
jgi:hypothetical protein